ncbi:hypothetical protein TNCV_1110121 [Trichonephila clavipes]|nr:hypothetical protein TNCV_1110121 [Trichonephila clavipes]
MATDLVILNPGQEPEPATPLLTNTTHQQEDRFNTCITSLHGRRIKRDATRFGDRETQTEQIPDFEIRILRGTPGVNHVHPPAPLHLSLKLS